MAESQGGAKAVFEYFSSFIEDETGIVFSPCNAYQLENRLQEVCKVLGVADAAKLYERALKEGGVQGQLKNLILDFATNNETSFFRDPKLFVAFEKSILPALRARSMPTSSLRIWSVASSFGQEAYSIAIILEQQEAQGRTFSPTEILTTDISTRALAKVNAAKYSQLEVTRGLPPEYLARYFEPTPDEQWELKPSIRRKVRSEKVNLLKIRGVTGKFDVIFCRNVLIYQSEARKKQIVEALGNYLEPGGYFILGAAESMLGLSESYEQIFFEGAVFYKKR